MAKFVKRHGWLGEDHAKAAYEKIGGDISPEIVGSSAPYSNTGRYMLYEQVRKYQAKDLQIREQKNVGACTGFNSAISTLLLQISEFLNGDSGDLKYPFIPYHYGCGRLLIGTGVPKSRDNPTGDGSCSIWQVKAFQKYGLLPEDGEGLPANSPENARLWGENKSLLLPWVNKGDDHQIKSYAKMSDVYAVAKLLANGYPGVLSSSVGFTMQPQKSGYHEVNPKDPWPHTLCLGGIDLTPGKTCAMLYNDWGPIHGTIIDWVTGETWPPGTLRIRLEALAQIIRADDSYNISDMVNFEGKPNLVWDDFTTFQ